MEHDPLSELREALLGGEGQNQPAYAHLDLRRERRKGVPEVVLADHKAPKQTVAIARQFLEQTGRAIISRTPPETLVALEQAFTSPIVWERYEAARMVVLRQPGYTQAQTGGRVGVITAGTADIPAAEEAAGICREMGCDVHTIFDVGVAGLHRLFGPLQQLLELPVDAIIVAAGMDGALPSVVAGLVDVPVIGLPTSVGYGLGGRGEAAILSMLQSCAPGMAVVNIDNGIGAGAIAAIIANNMAKYRQQR